MVKPLNKEWELFGKKYRVAGAKGEKVDCNACGKQVSAAVNRLQSHLRVCPARPVLPLALAMQVHGHNAAAVAAAAGGACVGSDLDDAAAHPSTALVDPTDGLADTAELADSSASLEPSSTALAAMALPPAKRPKTSPVRSRWSGPMLDDYWLPSTTSSVATPSPSTVAYAKRRLEIDERRLQLELRKDGRDERRQQLEIEILEVKARKERLAAEKEAYAARVALALSRKQLRDQGVAEAEIDRLLPIAPFASVVADVDTAAAAVAVAAAAAAVAADADESATATTTEAEPATTAAESSSEVTETVL
ncbi:hypothetical protein P43SY_004764 [Pythium insidiosum]|uniref:BED-type domain-containing protein n=1 Tax=Pythium insidiosum TaxID=114742 RepID=A0AAD5M9U8_PYTIN|nr:hypothetical protein P43SY_004764 [Pythium insidiosum]